MINRKFKKVFITGITGSGGSYLAEYIVENHPDIKVTGSTRWHSTASLKNLSELNKRVELYECDLNDLSSVIKVLKILNQMLFFI